MSYTLLFKIRTNNSLLSVISESNENLMSFNCYEEKLNYSPDTLLEEEQCFKIKEFSKQDYYPDFLKNNFATSQYNQWNSNDQNIEFICNANGQNYYFQKSVRSKILNKNWLSLSNEPKLEYGKKVEINSFYNAFYSKKEDVLLFKRLDDLKRIFPGIEKLYREATQQEVSSFLSNSLFKADKYDVSKLGILNRKRIALTLKNLDQIKDKKEFCRLLQDYCPDIEVQNKETIVIKTENDLKNVLYALDEKFYTTSMSEEKRLANSIVRLK